MAVSNRIITRAVGVGAHNDSKDVIAAKKALNRIGFYVPPQEGIGDDVDAGLDRAVRVFQAGNGLKVDGLMKPGGETERNLVGHVFGGEFERVRPAHVVLKRGVGFGGENDTSDVKSIKRAFRALGRYRYDRTRPPPPYIDTPLVDAIRQFQRDNGLFDDGLIKPDGETLPALRKLVATQQPDGRDRKMGKPRPGETEIAFAPAIPAVVAGAEVLAPYIGPALGAIGAAIVGQKVIDAARQQTDEPPPSTPPSPSEPPEFDGGPQGFPAEAPRLPAHTEFPVPDDPRDLIEILPDQSGEFNIPIIYENSRGGNDTQKDNTDVARIGTEAAQEDGRSASHTHGGHDVNGKYLKELYMENIETGKRLGSSRPDIVFQSQKTDRRLFINTVDTKASGKELTTREHDAAVRIIMNGKSGDILVTAPKSKGKTINLDALKEFLRPLLKEIDRPTPKIDPRSKSAPADLMRRWFPPDN